MSLHADAVSLLERWGPPSPEQQALRQRYLQVLRARPDAMTRECRPDHLTASTLVLSADGTEVLLTLHAKAQRWFQFGGHCESADATLVGAARREAVEESGIHDLVLDPVPVQLSEHAVPFCGPSGSVHHLDVRFVAVAPPRAQFATSEESLDVRWWPAGDLPDSDLAALVDLAIRRTQSGGGGTCEAIDQPSR